MNDPQNDTTKYVTVYYVEQIDKATKKGFAIENENDGIYFDTKEAAIALIDEKNAEWAWELERDNAYLDWFSTEIEADEYDEDDYRADAEDAARDEI